MTFETIMLFCADCGTEQLFETPPCIDGHGGDCPDLACTACGLAVLVGDVVAEAATALPVSAVA